MSQGANNVSGGKEKERDMKKCLKGVTVLMLSAALLLTGCGGQSGKQNTSTASQDLVIPEKSTESISPESQEEKPGDVDMSERIKVTVLTTRNNAATTDVTELWWFQHLSDKFNIDFELTQTTDTEESIGLMFSTGDMYDMIWGIPLSTRDAVRYGDGEGMIMDWSEYLNEDMMPNAYQVMQNNPEAFFACTTNSGKIYGLPDVGSRGQYQASGSLTNNMRMFINKKDMEACGVSMPVTMDDFLDMLRTFKEKDPNNVGKDYVPFLSTGKNDKTYFWAAFGYVGVILENWGTSPAYKDGEIYLPCYTDDYKEFVRIWHTMYEEGLMSRDYFDTGINTNAWRALMSQGLCSVMSDTTTTRLSKEDAPDYFLEWAGLKPVRESDSVKVYASLNRVYHENEVYVSSTAQHKDRIAKMIDYCYTPEGKMHYDYGPMKGSEYCTDQVKGWFFDENGTLVIDEENGDTDFVTQYIKPTLYAPGGGVPHYKYMYEIANQPYNEEIITKTDALTGKTFTVTDQGKYTDPMTVDACWRYALTEAWKDNLTTLVLPDLYLSEEDMARLSDLKTAITEYVDSETAQFIVGARDLDTMDAFMDDLKKLGIDDLLALYRTGYADFLKTVK